jgi:ribosomal protein S1
MSTLCHYGTGLIYGKEFIQARDVVKKINIGDTVSAKVVDYANKEGYIELSLREARQAQIWSEAEKAIKEKTVFELPVEEANKGGLLIAWQGIKGFLPASQLKSEHYQKLRKEIKTKFLKNLENLLDKKLPLVSSQPIQKKENLFFLRKILRRKKSKRWLTNTKSAMFWMERLPVQLISVYS